MVLYPLVAMLSSRFLLYRQLPKVHFHCRKDPIRCLHKTETAYSADILHLCGHRPSSSPARLQKEALPCRFSRRRRAILAFHYPLAMSRVA